MVLDKTELNTLIKRRYNEGKTLSIQRIDDEQYSKWYIHGQAKKFYGTWTNALIANGVRPNNVINVTKQDVINELYKLQSEGHSMKTSEFDHWLNYGITKYFGGYKKAKEELGIKPKRKKRISVYKYTENELVEWLTTSCNKYKTRSELYQNEKRLIAAIHHRGYSLESFSKKYGVVLPQKRCKVKWDKTSIGDTLVKLRENGYPLSSNQLRKNGYAGMITAAKRIFGTWNKCLEYFGIDPYLKVRKFENRDEVAQQYLKDREEGISRGDITYRQSIKKYFGNIDNLEKYLGIYQEPLAKTDYSEKEINEIISRCLEDETIETLNIAKIDEKYPGLKDSIDKHYGSVIDYFSNLDIDFYAKPRVPFIWNKENVKRQLLRWIKEGKPVNYTAVQDKGIVNAARKFYGSWENVFKACGLNYDDFRIDTDMYSYYGRKFEDIVAEILDACEIKYIREPFINGCRPDFVCNFGWVDVKLSEWTGLKPNSETIKKYEPHCKTLTLVYLFGDRGGSRWVTNKTNLVSVYSLIDYLDNDYKPHFLEKISEFERIINENVA